MSNIKERKLDMYEGEFFAVTIGQRPGTDVEFVGYNIVNKQTGVTEDFSTYLSEANRLAEQLDEWAGSTFNPELAQDSRVATIN